MTNEQTIAVFKNMIRWNNEHGNTLLCIGEVQALEMAIKALRRSDIPNNSQNQPNSELKTTTDSVSATDVIYRQDAINAVMELCKYYTVSHSVLHPHIDFVIEELNKVPSAQPDVIRCKDCKHLQNFKGVDWCLKLVRHTEPDFFCGFGEEVKDATAQDSIRSK